MNGVTQTVLHGNVFVKNNFPKNKSKSKTFNRVDNI